MSKFVYNLRFISTKAQKAALVKYVATREGVEKVTLSDEAAIKPETPKQQELVRALLKEYPASKGLLEYEDYSNNPTMRNASNLISSIMDNNADGFFSPEKYLGYISQRPGVEKQGTHGLFSSEENINLQKAIDEVSSCNGKLYTGVLSLRREDAHRLTYENAATWKAVIEKNLPTIAEAYKIPISDLKWYGAFHNESHHPHCHLLIYSTGKQPYINRTGIEKIKSAMATDIFRDELSVIYKEQQQSITATYDESAKILDDITTTGKENIRDKLLQLSEKLEKYQGKKVYGYLPKEMKALVNSIASDLAKEPAVQDAYNKYLDAREKQLLIYHSKDSLPPREDIADNVKFKKIKNLIVKEAVALNEAVVNISDDATVSVANEESTATEPHPDFNVDDENSGFAPAAEPQNKAASETSAESLDTSEEFDKLLAERIGSDSFSLSLHKSKDERVLYKKIKNAIYKANSPAERKTPLNNLFRLAISGNAYAVYDIASFSASGRFIEKNEIFSSAAYKKVLNTFLTEQKTDNEFLKNYLSYRIGKMYYYGLGTEKDISKAIEFLSPPADIGNAYANFTLGRIYESESEIGIDIPKAMEYYKLSLEKEDNYYAAYQLGKIYYFGAEGLEVDKDLGKYYLQLAADNGVEQAKNILNYHAESNTQASLAAVSLFINALRMFGGNGHSEEHKPRFQLGKLDTQEKIKRGEKISYDFD